MHETMNDPVLEKLSGMNKPFLTADELGEIIDAAPQNIRSQAQGDPSKLGFPVTVIGTRVRIPRLGFINWYVGRKA